MTRRAFFLIVLLSAVPASAALFPASHTVEEIQARINRLPEEGKSKLRASLYAQMGTALYRGGRMAEAAEAFEKSLEYRTTKALRRHIYVYLGKSYESYGRLDKAISAYEQAVAHDRRNARRYRDLAGLYARTKLYRKAVTTYEDGLRRDPHDSVALFGLGQSWRKIGLYAVAEPILKRAAKEGHDHLQVQRELSMLYEGEGRYAEAAEAWVKGLGNGAAPEADLARWVYLAGIAGNSPLVNLGIARMKALEASPATIQLYENLVELLRSDPATMLSLQAAGPGIRSIVESLSSQP